jgi:hypothetical protein
MSTNFATNLKPCRTNTQDTYKFITILKKFVKQFTLNDFIVNILYI